MRALRDFNTPKIPATDIPVFLRLISDLFPGLELATNVDEVLKETAIKVSRQNGFQSEDVFIAKVVQFQELLDVRHSVMLLGPPGAGKSTIYQTLVACKNLDQPKPLCVYEAVNPKAVRRGVPSCCGVFTSLDGLVAIARCRGWFVFRI